MHRRKQKLKVLINNILIDSFNVELLSFYIEMLFQVKQFRFDHCSYKLLAPKNSSVN